MIEHSNIVPEEVSVSMSHSLFNPQKQKAVDPQKKYYKPASEFESSNINIVASPVKANEQSIIFDELRATA